MPIAFPPTPRFKKEAPVVPTALPLKAAANAGVAVEAATSPHIAQLAVFFAIVFMVFIIFAFR
jgi:hypothetical protein